MKTKALFPLLLLVWLPVLFAPLTAAEKRPTSRSAERETAVSSKIDINTADVGTLESLPGVGPAIARAIVADQPFASVNDLERVPGIGPERLRELKDLVTVATPAAVTKATGPRVDLNTASLDALESLPGVGPEIAREIVAARPFRSIADLENVRGIGPQRMKELQGRVMVSGVKASSDRAVKRTDASRRVDDERSTRTAASTSAARRINLNTASREELEALPEIGPVKAQAIIDARPFASVEDVMRVKGIKDATFEAIKDQVMVR